MTNDFRDYRSPYLSHHGVLGMKWGVRRYQPYSIHPRKGGEGGKEVGEAKKRAKPTTYGYAYGKEKESFNILKSHARRFGRNVSGTVKDFAKAKGVIKKGSALFGNKARERKHENESKFYKERADGAWLQKNTIKREIKSENHHYLSEYYKRKQTMSLGKRFMNVFTHNEYYKTPYRTLSGGLTTIGNKKLVDEYLQNTYEIKQDK